MSRSPATSKWWSKSDLLVDGKIGGAKLRLSIVIGSIDTLIATDSEGQTGDFKPTPKMADGEYLWQIQESPDDEDEGPDLIDQRVVLTKSSNDALMDRMMSWQARGEFDIIAALK